MAPFLRKVKTASGATAVQIADKTGGAYRILEHLGSAHTDAELAALMAIGRDKLHPDQGVFPLPSCTGLVTKTLWARGALEVFDECRGAGGHIGWEPDLVAPERANELA